MSATTSPFLDKIPFEIREMVYQEYFKSSNKTITANRNEEPMHRLRTPSCIDLLLTCKTIHSEAEEDYRKHTEFLVKEGMHPDVALKQRVSKIIFESCFNFSNFLDTFTQSPTYVLDLGGRKLDSMTVVSRSTPFSDWSRLLLNPNASNPLGDNTKKLRQIIDLKNDTRVTPYYYASPCIDRTRAPVPIILEACDPNNEPLYSPVRLAIITTVQRAIGDVSTKLEIFVQQESEVKAIYNGLVADRRGEFWLREADIVVYLTGCWPYRSFKAERKAAIGTGAGTITWEGEEDGKQTW